MEVKRRWRGLRVKQKRKFVCRNDRCREITDESEYVRRKNKMMKYRKEMIRVG